MLSAPRRVLSSFRMRKKKRGRSLYLCSPPCVGLRSAPATCARLCRSNKKGKEEGDGRAAERSDDAAAQGCLRPRRRREKRGEKGKKKKGGEEGGGRARPSQTDDGRLVLRRRASTGEKGKGKKKERRKSDGRSIAPSSSRTSGAT